MSDVVNSILNDSIPSEEPVVEPEVEEPEPEPVVEEPEPEPVVEEPEPVVEEPEPEPVVEVPEPEPEPVVEEPVVEEPEPEPVVEEPEPEPVPVEQVASNIREILTTPVVEPEPEPVSSELSEISLATLIRVLGQWSGGDIRKRSVESELLLGTEKDENLDNVEKMVEILKLWIQEKGSGFKSHDNYFKNIDDYTLVGESKNWSDEKKKEVVLQIVRLTIDVSNRRISSENIHSIVNSL